MVRPLISTTLAVAIAILVWAPTSQADAPAQQEQMAVPNGVLAYQTMGTGPSDTRIGAVASLSRRVANSVHGTSSPSADNARAKVDVGALREAAGMDASTGRPRTPPAATPVQPRPAQPPQQLPTAQPQQQTQQNFTIALNPPSDLRPNRGYTQNDPAVPAGNVTLRWRVAPVIVDTQNPVVTHFLELWYWDFGAQNWRPVYTGYTGQTAHTSSETSYTIYLPPHTGFAWRVLTVDPTSRTSSAPSSWAAFRT
jgi:hypothetical protein